MQHLNLYLYVVNRPSYFVLLSLFLSRLQLSYIIIMSKKMKVCVVGAGGAGLCAARNLSRLSQLFQIDVFEQTESVGGTWVYTPETGTRNGLPIHQSMYKNLR